MYASLECVPKFFFNLPTCLGCRRSMICLDKVVVQVSITSVTLDELKEEAFDKGERCLGAWNICFCGASQLLGSGNMRMVYNLPKVYESVS